MADTSTQDVVKQAQSVGDSSLTGVSENTQTSTTAGGNEEPGSGGETQNASSTTPSIVNGTDPADSSNGQDATTTNDEPHINGMDSASYNGSDGDRQQDDTRRPEEMSWRDRSNSFAKRATPFKSVNVTKNFIKSASSVPPSTAKPTLEKTLTGGQAAMTNASVAKPRLVAKKGTDKLSHAITGTPSIGGPDANKVWNRNRPAPTQPVKQLTDEELKQQYGIHMATRLLADDANKEGAKWADIDDDEDDWAPETVQWMDGTKSSLTAEKILPITTKAPQILKKPSTDAEFEKKTLLPQAQPPMGLASAGKTILRPGHRTTSNTVQVKPGLALRSVPEASTPPVKQIQGSSGKSPWAQLPAIDKASPVVFDPPAQQIHRPFAYRHDSSAIDDLPTSSPAKEIAADDFDRTWREHDRGSQTLFNSQSGRYEPVKGARRTSRNDSGFRPPSVLLRPSQGQAQMEVFHNREAQPWARRRESSSYDNSRPLPGQPDSSNQTDPSTADATPHQQMSSDHSNHEPAEGAVDPRIEQQKQMHERIERNRKRKQEEEAQEEAAKQERIRLRLAAMAPLDEQAGKREIDITTDLKHPPSSEQAPAIEASSISQPPPDQPSTAISDMKNISSPVAASSVANIPSHISPPTSFTHSQQPSDRTPTLATDTTPNIPPSNFSSAGQNFAKTPANNHSNLNRSPEFTELPGLGQPPPDYRQQNNWNRHQNSSWTNRHAPMAAAADPAVWGPTSFDRTIGNGAFGSDHHRYPSTHQIPPRQAPIGSNAISPAFMSPHPTPSPPTIGSGHPHNMPPTTHHAMTNNGQMSQENGPRGFFGGHQNRQTLDHAAREAGRSAWQAYPENVDMHDDNIRTQTQDHQAQEFQRKLAEKRAAGQSLTSRPTITETYRPTGSGATASSGRVVTKHETIAPEGAFGPVTHGMGSQQAPSQAPLQPVPNGRHTSRFFGPAAERASPSVGPIQAPIVVAPIETDDPTDPIRAPPPPETPSHPAFDTAGTNSPLVRMPTIKPTVRLPPATAESVEPIPAKQTNVTMPSRHPSGSQAIAQNPDWQARFKGLFEGMGRPYNATSTAPVLRPNIAPAAQQSAPIASSTKAAYHTSPAATTATVSLPNKTTASKSTQSVQSSLPDTEAQTKPMIEPLMDERVHGAEPWVNIPRGPQPRDARVLAPLPNPPAPATSGKKPARMTAAEFNTFALEVRSKTDLSMVGNPHKVRVLIDGKPPGGKILNRLRNGQASQTHNKGEKSTGKAPVSNKPATTTTESAAATKPVNQVENISSAVPKPATQAKAPESSAAPASTSTASAAVNQTQAARSDQGSMPHVETKKSGYSKAPKGPRAPRRGGYNNNFKPLSAQRQTA